MSMTRGGATCMRGYKYLTFYLLAYKNETRPPPSPPKYLS